MRIRVRPLLVFIGIIATILISSFAKPGTVMAAGDSSQGLISVERDGDSTFPPAALEVNGVTLEVSIQPMERGGQLFVSARPVLEALGYQVVWRQDREEVWFRRHGERGSFRAGEAKIYFNGEAMAQTSPPFIIEGISFIPLSLLRTLGEEVRWDSDRRVLALKRDDPTPRAFLGLVEGRVLVYRKESGAPEMAFPGMELKPGDRVRTWPGSGVEIELDDGSLVQLAASSELEVGKLGVNTSDISRAVSFRILIGRVMARVTKLVTQYSRFEIETPTGVAGVRGTVFMVDVDSEGKSHVSVYSGAVKVKALKDTLEQAVLVKADEETEVVKPEETPTPPTKLRGVKDDEWFRKAVKKAIREESLDLRAPGEAAPSEEELEHDLESRIKEIEDVLRGKDEDKDTGGGKDKDKGKDGDKSEKGYRTAHELEKEEVVEYRESFTVKDEHKEHKSKEGKEEREKKGNDEKED